MAKNKGAEGQGASKSIAEREALKKGRKSRAHRKPSMGTHDVLDMAILTADDFVNGHAITGHLVAIGDAVFEMKKETLVLAKATCKQLAPFVDKMQYVFVTEGQLTNDAFESPLSHTSREKQMMMWNYIRSIIGEEGRVAILKRREMSRLVVSTKPAAPTPVEATPLPERKSALYVEENAKRWNDATTEIATAFESMSAEKPAEIRIGTNQHEGVTLGFFHSSADNIRIYTGHAGAKSPLAGKVLEGVYLEVRHGQLSETISETLNASERGKGVFIMHGFLMGLPRNLRDPIMHGMLHAVGRIQQSLRPTRPPLLHVVKTTAPDLLSRKSPIPDAAAPAKNGLQEMVEALVKGGASPEVIVQATLAYQASQAGATSSNKAA